MHHGVVTAEPSQARRSVRRLLGGLADPEKPVIGDLATTQWVALWQQCHGFVQGSPVRVAFPDGRPLNSQPALLVNMFTLIHEEWAKELEDAMKRER